MSFPLCDYCQEKEAVEKSADGKVACWDCYSYICEEQHANQQAEEGYARFIAEQNEPGPVAYTEAFSL